MRQPKARPGAPVPSAGLLAEGSAVPLLGVAVEATLAGFAARVTLAQRYRNDGAKPLEAVYVFPLDEGAAVCGFEVEVDGRVVKGKVLEREKAFELYDEALSAGHGGYLLDEERADVFTASVGNLPPGREVVVRITTVAELAAEGDALRFTLPTTVSPRYAPARDRVGVGRTPAEALNPPVALEVPYGLSLRVALDMPSEIRGVESPSHPVSFDLDGPRGTVTLGTAEAALDRDFVLLVRLAAANAPGVRVERGPDGAHVAMLSFAPRFGEGSLATAGAPKGEVVFLVDRSGSMGGSSIAEARNALQLCLRSLPAGLPFNVVGFGSTHEALFPASRPYDETSLAEASAHVKALEADLGGTEVLRPLEAILPSPVAGGGLRQLFVLTDGEVSNSDEVLELVRRHSATNRPFAFGIGAGASHHLVKGIARAGRGASEMIAPGERIEAKVMRQFARALSPALDDVRVDWGGAKVRQAPHEVPPVFENGRVVVYGFLERPFSGDVVLRAKAPHGEVAFPVRLDTVSAAEGSLLATLAARTLIRDLEEGASPLHPRRGSRQERAGRPPREDAVKAEIVRLGETYGLASRETSWVAVEERASPETGEIELKKVPIALTRGWGGIAEGAVASYAPSGVVGSMAPPTGFALRLSAADMDACYEIAEASEHLRSSRPGPPPAKAKKSPRLLERLAGPASLARPASSVSCSVPASPRPLDLLVALQKADGSWELGGALAVVLGLPLATLEAPLAGVPGDPVRLRTTWATALALAWLEENAPGSRDEWRLLARKARAWLDANGVPAPPGRPWTEEAAALLRT